MKKIIIFASVFALLLSVLSACNDKVDESNTTQTTTTTPNTHFDGTYVTTAPEFTVGAVETSQKIEITDEEYHIAYYDSNGAGAKLEVYRNGKLVYYYVSSSVDDTGNCIQQKYYKANGEFVGTFDNGYFFDANGNQISEDVMNSKLGL